MTHLDTSVSRETSARNYEPVPFRKSITGDRLAEYFGPSERYSELIYV